MTSKNNTNSNNNINNNNNQESKSNRLNLFKFSKKKEANFNDEDADIEKQLQTLTVRPISRRHSKTSTLSRQFSRSHEVINFLLFSLSRNVFVIAYYIIEIINHYKKAK